MRSGEDHHGNLLHFAAEGERIAHLSRGKGGEGVAITLTIDSDSGDSSVLLEEDFFVLLDGIGATGVNAYTSYDMTCYHNSFPAASMYKWLTIFSDRLIDPAYRILEQYVQSHTIQHFDECAVRAGRYRLGHHQRQLLPDGC